MIGLFAEARAALTGVLLILGGRRDFHAKFDISSGGLARSFLAAFVALPLSAFSVTVRNSLAVQFDPDAEVYTYGFVVARWVVVWAYFPFLAAVFTRAARRRDAFAPWVVVNNWTHLFIVIVQTFAFTLAPAGMAPAAVVLLDGSVLLMLYAYVVAARAALDADWTLSAFAGILNVAVMLGLGQSVRMLF